MADGFAPKRMRKNADATVYGC